MLTIKDIYLWLQKPRSGRIDERRGIPKEIAETVWQHSKKVAKAAEIYGAHFSSLNHTRLKKIGKNHDMPERKEEDYTPWQISKEEKHTREKAVMLEIKKYGWQKWSEAFDLWMEYEHQQTPESILIMQLDKLDAAIQALEYEKMWYNVSEFFDYTLWKLQDPTLIKILNILLEKKYPHINAYDQYFFLLKNNWNEVMFEEYFSSISP